MIHDSPIPPANSSLPSYSCGQELDNETIICSPCFSFSYSFCSLLQRSRILLPAFFPSTKLWSLFTYFFGNQCWKPVTYILLGDDYISSAPCPKTVSHNWLSLSKPHSAPKGSANKPVSSDNNGRGGGGGSVSHFKSTHLNSVSLLLLDQRNPHHHSLFNRLTITTSVRILSTPDSWIGIASQITGTPNA